MNYRLLALFVVAFCAYATLTHAQMSVTGGLELTASTDNPVPGQTVTVTARSYTIDINAARVTWTVNGTVMRNAAGATSYEVIAPPLGKRTTIEVSAVTTEGVTVKSSIIIGSGSIDLIFESDGYTPPFFRGKLTPVYQNTLRITAIPHLANSSGTEYDPTTLVYQWKRNGRVIEGQSGYGRQTLTLTGEVVPRPYDISVAVWSRDNSASTEAITAIDVTGPRIGFYLDDPLYGPLYNKSVGSTVRIGDNKEVSVLSVPFGFNKPSDDNGDLDIVWGLNGRGVTNLRGHESIILRSPEGAGTSQVQINIRNTDKILQGASATFSALFNSTAQEQASFNTI